MRTLCLLLCASTVCHCTITFGGDLVWSDEFNTDGPPDPTKWTYEEGFVRNRELQYYTQDVPKNARVKNGNLVIEAHKERFSNARYEADAPERRWQRSREFADYTSASLTTQGLADWTYGRIEVRAKLPRGRGVWPAIWMLGTNITQVGWPACGELDIMEFVGHEPDTVHFNVHTRGYNHAIGKGRGSRLSLPDAAEDWHLYALNWSPERLVFLLDGKPGFTLENDGTGVDSWPFNAPEYLILNLAIGGAWGAAKGVDESIFPQQFLIDYVRIYQHDFARWEKDIAAFEATDRTNPPPDDALLFMGSSTIRMWKTLAEDFPGQQVINRGFGGSEIVDSTHFSERILFRYEPRMILFRAGGNDLWNGKSPERVFADYQEFVAMTHAKLPETEIVWISWSPTESRWKQADKEKRLNTLVEEFSRSSPKLKYIETYDLVLGSDGRPRPELFLSDQLHLNALGYKLLAERVRPYLPK